MLIAMYDDLITWLVTHGVGFFHTLGRKPNLSRFLDLLSLRVFLIGSMSITFEAKPILFCCSSLPGLLNKPVILIVDAFNHLFLFG